VVELVNNGAIAVADVQTFSDNQEDTLFASGDDHVNIV